MSGRFGFTLVETLVAALVGVLLVVAVGLLGGSLVRHRVSADTLSAATRLAEKELETLRNVPDPLVDLVAGTSTWRTVDEAGNPSLAGPFQVQTEIQDNQPSLPETLSKRLTARVRYAGRPTVLAELTTYMVVAQPTLSSTPAPTPTPGGSPTPTPTGIAPTPTITPTPRPTPTPTRRPPRGRLPLPPPIDPFGDLQ
jgi:type II secretory pathway pseudopilin PulG